MPLEDWTRQLIFFRRRMMVIALDNRGIGGSSRPNYPYTMDMFVEEIKALLDFLGLQQKIHLCGISMGGMIAQNFVLKYPNKVKTLILLSTSAPSKNPPPPIYEVYRNITQGLGLKEAFKQILDLGFSEKFLEKVYKDKFLHDALYDQLILKSTNIASWQDLSNRAVAVYNANGIRESLHKISQPTLVIHGTADEVVLLEEAQFLHEKIPNSKLITFEDLKHGCIFEYPEKIDNLIWTFIEEHLD